MLLAVQLEHELNQRSLEFGSPIGIENKTAARKLGGARQIDQFQFLAQLDMRFGLKRESRLRAGTALNG